MRTEIDIIRKESRYTCDICGSGDMLAADARQCMYCRRDMCRSCVTTRFTDAFSGDDFVCFTCEPCDGIAEEAGARARLVMAKAYEEAEAIEEEAVAKCLKEAESKERFSAP